MTDGSRRGGLADRFRARHSNPKSGWSRVPTGALLVLAVYRRDARLLAAAVSSGLKLRCGAEMARYCDRTRD